MDKQRKPLIERPIIVGVLNITPDSFSDGGKFLEPRAALQQAENLLAAGADILDLGAESSRPGATAVNAVEEFARLKPVLVELCRFAKVSLDTYKAETAERGLDLGVSMINDISALTADKNMAAVCARYNCELVLMHSKEQQGLPHATAEAKEYTDIVSEIGQYLLARASEAQTQGIAREKIILDPGFGGFLSPKSEYSWELLKRFSELTEAVSPYPLYVGTSRKSFLNVPLEERDPLSALTSLWAYQRGARYLRVHNVQLLRECLCQSQDR